MTEVLFGSRTIGELSGEELSLLAAEIPTVKLSDGLTLIDALVTSGIASSKSEARRLIQGNAVSVNGVKATEDRAIDGLSLIKKGRNQFALAQ